MIQSQLVRRGAQSRHVAEVLNTVVGECGCEDDGARSYGDFVVISPYDDDSHPRRGHFTLQPWKMDYFKIFRCVVCGAHDWQPLERIPSMAS